MTEDELAAIRDRDREAGPEEWEFTVNRVPIELDPIVTDLPFRTYESSPYVTVEVTAGATVVLRLEDAKTLTTTPALFHSWGRAIDDRRRLLAELDRLRTA